METLTGDRVIINVVTLVAAPMVEEIRLAIMALRFSGGGSRRWKLGFTAVDAVTLVAVVIVGAAPGSSF